ncbi:MAG: glycerol acyltransferase [Aureispira sp.]|nr:glycerol acyltransferase [Aureispira sp.]
MSQEVVKNDKKLEENKKEYPFPYVISNMQDWPIYKFSQDREGFVKQVYEFTAERLLKSMEKDSLSEALAKILYLERIRIIQDPWRVDPPDEMDFWSDIKQKLLKGSLDQDESEVFEHNKELLERIVQRYAQEIVGSFKIPTYKLARKVLPMLFNTILNAVTLFRKRGKLQEKLKIVGATDHVRSLIKKGTIVLVPTHFSNLDSILIGWAADRIGLTALSYGAGINLYNNRILEYYFTRLGAYGVDRRKKNGFYLETLKAFSQLAIEKGVHSLFFPGGTRSRSGQLETKLKMGLLGTAVDAQNAVYQRGEDNKVYIVPVVLNYHFVLEAKSLIDQYLKHTGKELYLVEKKAFGGAWNFFKFLWQFFSASSEIVVNFGQPMDVLGNFVDEEGVSLDQFGKPVNTKDYFVSGGELKYDTQRNSQYTKKLADKIVKRYHVENIVLSSHLITFTALKIFQKQYPSLDLYGLLRLPKDDKVILKNTFDQNIEKLREQLRKMEAAGEIQLSEEVRDAPLDELIKDGIHNCSVIHVKKPLKIDKEGDITTQDMNLLYYYHNRLLGYNLGQYIDVRAIKKK